jgi:hypothetical protein
VTFHATSASPSVTSLTLKVDGIATPESPASISPQRTIAMTASVPVRLKASTFELTANTSDGQHVVVAAADDVVAGDVFVVTGQSNALAEKHPQEFDLVQRDAASPWIRTVGGMLYKAPSDPANHAWHIAKGGPFDGSSLGTVGEWALRMARDVVDQQSVPVAVLNGGKGGLAISGFLPQPDGAIGNFERLKGRLDAYGLATSVRAVFLNQGEADIHDDDPALWRGRFDTLRSAWIALFPKLAHVYVTQIRGCNEVSGTNAVREVQRQLATTAGGTPGNPDTQVMSTTGMTGFDGGCHFYYAGYKQLGHWYADLLLHDVYGVGGVSNITAPSVATIARVDNDLLLTLASAGDPVKADSDSRLDFFVTTTKGTILHPSAISATSSNGAIKLTLPKSTPAVKAVSFRGQSGPNGHPWITNANGIGLLAFEGMPVP